MGASLWNGDFNHVQFLAEDAGYRQYIHSLHEKNDWVQYGTAILSQYPVIEAYGLSF